MIIQLKTPNIILTIILGTISLATMIWAFIETIKTFKYDVGLGILLILLDICYTTLLGIYLFALLFGIDIGSSNTPILIPIMIR